MMTYTGRIDHDDPYNKNIHMYNTKNLVKQSSWLVIRCNEKPTRDKF